MSLGFILAIVLVAVAPALLFIDGAAAQACVTLLSALLLGISAVRLQGGEIAHLRPILSRLLVAALLPGLWMLLQALPLSSFGHPIWASTSAALGTSLSATISVDPGATLVALGRYLGFVGLGLAVSIIAVERRHAEQILFALLTMSALMAVAALFLPSTFTNGMGREAFAALPTVLALGAVIAAAAVVRAYERTETKNPGPSWRIFLDAFPGIVIAATVLLLCLFGLSRSGNGAATVAAIFGLIVFGALVLIRRLGLGVWGVSAIIVALIIGFAIFSQADFIRPGSSPLVSQDGGAGIGERMLTDVRWVGTGAGTFGELAQLYRDIDEGPAAIANVSGVAIASIELGRPAVAFIGVVIAALLFALVAASIRRGRDSWFPMLGAATISIVAVTAFTDHNLLAPTEAIIVAVIVGLAVSQSAGRSAVR